MTRPRNLHYVWGSCLDERIETLSGAWSASALLEGRNRHVGSLLASELCAEYLEVLLALAEFRRRHEVEVMRDELYQAVRQRSVTDDPREGMSPERFDALLSQLETWGLVGRRLEASRIRSYRDVRRDRFRFRLEEEAAAFLGWLEERHAGESEFRGGDSLHLLSTIAQNCRRLCGQLAGETGAEEASSVVYTLWELSEKTFRLSGELLRITVRLSEFMHRRYSVEEARETVAGLDGYFRHYLSQLGRLRGEVMRELEMMSSETCLGRLRECFAQFEREQSRLLAFLSGGATLGAEEQLARLSSYYGLDGHVDRQCSVLHANALRVLGKLTSHLKELERRNGRLDVLGRCLKRLASCAPDVEPKDFLFRLVGSCAAPLDMNDGGEGQRLEPPLPAGAAGNTARRTPARTFRRNEGGGTQGGERVESHEEGRVREVLEYVGRHYPEGGDLSTADAGDWKQLSRLLQYGLLGGGRQLRRGGWRLWVDETGNGETEVCRADGGGRLQGPRTELRRWSREDSE